MSRYSGSCSSGCKLEGTKTTTLFSRDFTTEADQESFDDDYSKSFGNDGVVTFDEGGLRVTSNPFTARVDIGNEHVKWLAYFDQSFPLQNGGETIYKTTIAGKQHFNESIPFPPAFNARVRNAHEDIRLCSAAMNIIDRMNVYDWFLSDEKIYPFYERLPFVGPAQELKHLTRPILLSVLQVHLLKELLILRMILLNFGLGSTLLRTMFVGM